MTRNEQLVTGEYYHIFNKSIAKFIIFNTDREYQRMLLSLRYYKIDDLDYSFGQFIRLEPVQARGALNSIKILSDNSENLVEILAFCLMPTHFHLILKQLKDDGISEFMKKVLGSYALYFNKRYKRTGPLWTGRFRNVHVEDDDQLIHLTRYIHLNPSSAGLVKKPQDWPYSSYLEYLKVVNKNHCLCCPEVVIDTTAREYKKFVENRVIYQKELKIIERLTLE